MRREGAFKASLLLEPGLSVGYVSAIMVGVWEISTDRATESLHTSDLYGEQAWACMIALLAMQLMLCKSLAAHSVMIDICR